MKNSDKKISDVIQKNINGEFLILQNSDGTLEEVRVNPKVPDVKYVTTYILSSDDKDSYIRINHASPITITIPLNNNVRFHKGTSIIIEQNGAGVITVAGESGVTVNGFTGLSTSGQYAVVQIIKVDIDTWTLIGGA